MAFSQSAHALYMKDGSRVIGQVLEVDSVHRHVKVLLVDGTRLLVPQSSVKEIDWSYVIRKTAPGAIYRYGDSFRWKYNDTELSDKNYEKYFDDDLYHNYVTGSNLFNLGGAGLLYGITCAVMTVLSFDTKADHQSAAFFAYAGGAVVLTGAGIVLTKKGKARLDGVERTFNSRNAADNETSFSSKNKSFMQLNPSVLMTAQRDMGLGATLSFSF
ncbi:MAG: hypothetical protein IKN61_02915 [Bacteroidaceae bacterium]|nr:hypothetical protein [Bacteroidaceae bacterium]